MTNTTNSTQRAQLSEIRKRLADYSQHDYEAERDKLVAVWRAAHPDCANEPPSLKHHTLDKLEEGVMDDTEQPERWANDIYSVTVRRWSEDPVFGSRRGMIQLGISSLDGTARHDWRDFQNIKNQIAGEECEAFELYPAESRLLDPSNYYSLWCFPGLKRIKVGMNEGRRVLEVEEAFAPQRGFEK
jgi:hypothetical protein